MADFTVKQGDTLKRVWRWGTGIITYAPITAVAQSAPARITAPAHGLPDGWQAVVVSVKGMTQINAQNTPPRRAEYLKSTLVDANTITLNAINSSGFTPYTSGGYLMFNTPTDLTGYTAKAQVKDKAGGALLLDMTSRIVIDNTAKTITLTVLPAVTLGLAWLTGLFDLEMKSSGGIIQTIDSGTITVVPTITI